MTNRLIDIMADIDREAEHQRRAERVARSSALYDAACIEAVACGVSLSYSAGRYVIGDERCVCFFFPLTNVLMRSIAGRRRLEKIEIPESDVLDVVLLFKQGKFHE